jgi:transposase
MGLDAHRKFSKVTGRDAQGRVVCRQRIEHRDRRTLRAALGRWPKGTPVVLEGTFGWGWLSDELQRAGLEPHLASSRKVAAWREARGIAKSNRTDADLLSELWSQQPRWWEVWLAPQEVRDQREWMRYRMSLVHMQTGLKNRIHAILHRHGIVHDYSDLFGRGGRRFLNILVAEKEATLRESGKATLKGYLQLLDQVRTQIARVTRHIRRQLHRSVDGTNLQTIPGIASILSYTILAEIGRIDRFKTCKQLASYALLAPLADDSGEEDADSPKGRRIGLAGRRTLKWALIEAARGAVHHGGRFREMFDRRTDGGTKDRNRGYITVGHELGRVVHVVLKKQVAYRERPPARPGSVRRKRVGRKSRPGTGQPEPAMVAASTTSGLQTSQ